MPPNISTDNGNYAYYEEHEESSEQDDGVVDSTPNTPSPGTKALLNSSSPRPLSKHPSEYLMKTTASRVNDGEAMAQRRSSLVVPEIKPLKKVQPVSVAPSDSLMKTTQARLSDVREWQIQRGVIKHENDIWWEQRRPQEGTSKSPVQVESRLFEPTTSHIYSQRKKVPPRTTPDKFPTPGTPEKPPTPNGGRKTSRIPSNSPLLRSTFNSVVKNVKTAPVPPQPIQPVLFTTASGPQNVPSKLFELTTSVVSGQWRSPAELAAEEAATHHSPRRTVAAPSPHLVNYNESMRNSARAKARSKEGDVRETGWNDKVMKDHIPAFSDVRPLPAQRRSPGRIGDSGSPYRHEPPEAVQVTEDGMSEGGF